MIAHGVHVAGLDGRRGDVPPEALADLEARLAGRLVRPGDVFSPPKVQSGARVPNRHTRSSVERHVAPS